MNEQKTTTTVDSNIFEWTAPNTNPQKGWECPRCGKILAPWMSQCDCPRNTTTITWQYGYDYKNQPTAPKCDTPWPGCTVGYAPSSEMDYTTDSKYYR